MRQGTYGARKSVRTRWLTLGLAVALTGAQGCIKPDDGLSAWTSTADFKNPEEFQAEAGVYTLTVGPAEVTLEGKRYCLRSYNGKLTAPTLRVPASSEPRSFRVAFTNGFLRADPHHLDDTSHHEVDFNTTNLHTHGLHVSPGQTADGLFESDNVLLALKPQTSKQFRFDLDAGKERHPPGTFWYHPHVHGSTAIQVANGMAGALIIEGAVDQLPGIREARERIFVLQQIPYDYADVKPLAEGEPCNDSTLSINTFDWATKAQRTLVNGVPRPLLTLPPGQVERWRLIHAGVSQFVKVALYKGDAQGCSLAASGTPIPLQQIAEDGITFPRKEAREHVLMAPGYRVDVMVQAPLEEGTYCLMDAQSPKLDPAGAPLEETEPTHLLAVLKVDKSAGAPTGGMPSDGDLASVAPPTLDCAESASLPVQKVVFAQKKDENGNDCSSFFNINCKQYNPDVPRKLTLGATEEWQLKSEAGNHPFHIHVNAFTVCPGTVNGVEFKEPRWKDTLYVGSADGTVRVRSRYEDFTGNFVMHCHLLHHEDQGMMEAVEISAAP